MNKASTAKQTYTIEWTCKFQATSIFPPDELTEIMERRLRSLLEPYLLALGDLGSSPVIRTEVEATKP